MAPHKALVKGGIAKRNQTGHHDIHIHIHMILIRGVKDLDVRKLAVVVGEGRGAPPFALDCLSFVAFLVVRWAVAKSVVTSVTSLGRERVDVAVVGR